MAISSIESRKLQNRASLGILLMISGLALYALSDALLKKLMGTYSVPQTSFLRSLSRLIPLLIVAFMQGNIKRILYTEHPKKHLIRLGVNIAYTYSFMYAFSIASLTSTYTLAYSSSFFMILLSAWLLKENVSREKWIAVGVGMIGVLIAMRPAANAFEFAALVVLIGAFLGSLHKILMRQLAATEHSLTITIYPNIAMILVTLPLLASNWTPLLWEHWALCSLIGIVTAAGQYAIAQSLRFAQGSTLAATDYSSFFWVVMLDYFWWQNVPDIYTMMGAGVIIASNIYILSRSSDITPSRCI